MDYVITWVNNQDSIWQEAYKNAKMATINQISTGERFRDDYNFLKYHLRGIEKNLPWIHKVYLVVSNEEQVPDWINQTKIKVITHSQIIPEKYLPTFNSCTIEMFLHNIPDLEEEFIYANDDTYPINPCSPEDFFQNGKPLIHLNQRRLALAKGQFRKVIINTYNTVKKAFPSNIRLACGNYFKPEHLSLGHLKSIHDEVWKKLENEIYKSISQFREAFNFNQYLFTFATVLAGYSIDKKIDGEYTAICKIPNKEWITKNKHKQICLNDTKNSTPKNFLMVKEAFEELFPNKSKYEN